MSADEAARALGVQRATLYAYVSRGLIRSDAQEGTRARRYHTEDVERLARRRVGRRDPEVAAEASLHFGSPVLESSISLISDGALYFRGASALELAEHSRLEDVAAWLWGRPLPDDVPEPIDLGPEARRLPPAEHLQSVLAAAAARDPAAYDLSEDAVARCGARILRLMTAALAGRRPSAEPVAEVLAQAWGPAAREARPTLERALVLWTDHELNVSTFTVRCVASARATPYAAVIAGLSALRGALHGGVTEQVEALFDEVASPDRVDPVLQARLRRGERIPGFGHWLYPEGDPRARSILEALRASAPESEALRLCEALIDAMARVTERPPNVDLATVALRRALRLPVGAAFSLVAVARTVGWIAHALEQYGAARLIRPRARYTGPAPEAPSVAHEGPA